MVVTENPTALQIAASARFHGRDAASIGYLYDWYDAIPEMLDPKEELKHRFRELAAELRYLGTSQQELMELLKEGKESSHD